MPIRTSELDVETWMQLEGVVDSTALVATDGDGDDGGDDGGGGGAGAGVGAGGTGGCGGSGHKAGEMRINSGGCVFFCFFEPEARGTFVGHYLVATWKNFNKNYNHHRPPILEPTDPPSQPPLPSGTGLERACVIKFDSVST